MSETITAAQRMSIALEPKRVQIPDPYERTRNDPHYLMSSNDVLKLMKSFYHHECTFFGADQVKHDSGKEIITEHLIKVIISRAKEMGWGNVKLIGKQLEFIAYF